MRGEKKKRGEEKKKACVWTGVVLTRAVRKRLKNDCNIQGGITLVLSTEKPVAGNAMILEREREREMKNGIV